MGSAEKLIIDAIVAQLTKILFSGSGGSKS